MATSEGTVEKINVRSPFYLDVDSENAPASYTPPATITQTIECGSEINVGEDAGTRIYRIDTTGRTGDFQLSFTVNIPIKITTQFSEAGSATVHGFRGDSAYTNQLIDLGIAASDLTALADGQQQFGFTVTTSKTASDTGHLDVTIDAPMTTDDYKISFACPAITVQAQPTSIAPGDIAALANDTAISGTDSLYMLFRGLNGRLGMESLRGFRSTTDTGVELQIWINGAQVKGITSSELDWNANKDVLIIFSNEDTAGDGSLSGTPYNTRTITTHAAAPTTDETTADTQFRTPIMVPSTAIRAGQFGAEGRIANTIAFKFVSPHADWEGGIQTRVDRYGTPYYTGAGPVVTSHTIEFGITKLFKCAYSGTLEWANFHNYHIHQNFGYTLPSFPTIVSDTNTSYNSAPRLMTASEGNHNWVANSNAFPNAGQFYGFHYNPANVVGKVISDRRKIIQQMDEATYLNPNSNDLNGFPMDSVFGFKMRFINHSPFIG